MPRCPCGHVPASPVRMLQGVATTTAALPLLFFSLFLPLKGRVRSPDTLNSQDVAHCALQLHTVLFSELKF